jgi:hypothetical protein
LLLLLVPEGLGKDSEYVDTLDRCDLNTWEHMESWRLGPGNLRNPRVELECLVISDCDQVNACRSRMSNDFTGVIALGMDMEIHLVPPVANRTGGN